MVFVSATSTYLTPLKITGKTEVDNKRKNIIKCCGKTSCSKNLIVKKKPNSTRANDKTASRDPQSTSFATQINTGKGQNTVKQVVGQTENSFDDETSFTSSGNNIENAATKNNDIIKISKEAEATSDGNSKPSQAYDRTASVLNLSDETTKSDYIQENVDGKKFSEPPNLTTNNQQVGGNTGTSRLPESSISEYAATTEKQSASSVSISSSSTSTQKVSSTSSNIVGTLLQTTTLLGSTTPAPTTKSTSISGSSSATTISATNSGTSTTTTAKPTTNASISTITTTITTTKPIGNTTTSTNTTTTTLKPRPTVTTTTTTTTTTKYVSTLSPTQTTTTAKLTKPTTATTKPPPVRYHIFSYSLTKIIYEQ
jgi:hypothetical protein